MAGFVIPISYFVAAVLFIFGLKQMSSPVTARRGIQIAGIGMLLAVFVTFGEPRIDNLILMIAAIVIGTGFAWISAKRVAMTDMPQMVALYNGMGGGSAAAIAAVALVQGHATNSITQTLAVAGAIIGTVSFSGSIIAWAKLQGVMQKNFILPGHQLINAALLLIIVGIGIHLVLHLQSQTVIILTFFGAALVLGVLFTTPIGGADMPVVISLFNALTGLAVGFEGFVLQNAAMIIAGTVVGAAGTLLTQLMAKAMNRSLAKVLFSRFGASGTSDNNVEGSMKEVDANDAAIMMAYADKVVIVPGYGMAVAQAQHKIWELTELLTSRGVRVKFAIHPVAGRMPGHMNVLLAEAGVPYDLIYDLDEINAEFPSTDVTLIIGANDVVNPAARSDPSSPIHGMPILDADKSKQVIVIKRGKGKGFSGIENLLFFADNTQMLYGDGQTAVGELITGIKTL